MKKIILGTMLAAATLFAGYGTSAGAKKSTYLEGSDGKKYIYTIGTASETGSYYKAGRALTKHLGKDRKTGRYKAIPETTDGCGQNMNLMADGILNVVICQGDMVAARKATDPDFFKNVLALKLERKEAVQLIMRKGMDEDDVQSDKAKVLVGLANSGGAGSWDNITRLEPGYKKAKILYGDIDESALQDLEDGAIDAIVRTSWIDPFHDSLAQDVAKNKKIYFADFDDSDLNDKIDLGRGPKLIYNFADVVVDGHGWDTEAEVLETNVYILIDKANMSKKDKNNLIRVIKNRKVF